MDIKDKEIMERIRFRMKYLRLTYKKLAEKTGIPETTLQRYAKGGVKNIALSKVEALAHGLECDPKWLIGIDDEEKVIEPESKKVYYLDDEAAELAQEIQKRKDLRILFDASRKVSKEDLEFIIRMVENLDKKTN